MPSAKPKKILHELLWLLAILAAALPLAGGLFWLIINSSTLYHAFRTKLHTNKEVLLVLYVLVVLSCYLARLGAMGAKRVATAVPSS